jgi:hypothetical protein
MPEAGELGDADAESLTLALARRPPSIVAVQRRLIEKIADVLRSGGGLLFTAPTQSCSWRDILIGRISISLGRGA